MVFCNHDIGIWSANSKSSHNPYFNRWFSAIDVYVSDIDLSKMVTILILIDGFLQFKYADKLNSTFFYVTILILIDGFLQL